MPADQTPVTGPIPVTVRTTPAAVILDMEALTRLVIGDVIEALLDPEDTDLWDRLHELADTERAPQEGRLLTEEIVDDLADRSSSRILLTVTHARALADRLTQAVGRFVMPHQRNRRAA